MKSNIMGTINNMYKKAPSLEETELSKLESLLTQVGGDAKSILLKAEEYSMSDFIDICIRNGITFELSNDSSERVPASNNKPSPTQSPSEKEKACEEGCMEVLSYGERITLENWKELLGVGDVVICKDEEEGTTVLKTVAQLEDEDYDSTCFMQLNEDWVWFEYEGNTCEEGRSYYVEG